MSPGRTRDKSACRGACALRFSALIWSARGACCALAAKAAESRSKAAISKRSIMRFIVHSPRCRFGVGNGASVRASSPIGVSWRQSISPPQCGQIAQRPSIWFGGCRLRWRQVGQVRITGGSEGLVFGPVVRHSPCPRPARHQAPKCWSDSVLRPSWPMIFWAAGNVVTGTERGR